MNLFFLPPKKGSNLSMGLPIIKSFLLSKGDLESRYFIETFAGVFLEPCVRCVRLTLEKFDLDLLTF